MTWTITPLDCFRLVTLTVGTLLCATPLLAERDEANAIRERLLGSWSLVSWEERDQTGRVNYPLGPKATGQLIYTRDARMSAQLMRPGSRRFATDDWRQATTADKSSAWGDYFGYFGTFSIDVGNKAVVHHIEGSWFPNLVGTDQVRHFRFDGDRLILDAKTAWGNVHIIWRKVAPPFSAKASVGVTEDGRMKAARRVDEGDWRAREGTDKTRRHSLG
jgi:hypothetical protein